jgi:hypothetical protein
LANSTEQDSVFEELRIKRRKPEEETNKEENNGRGGGGCCWHHHRRRKKKKNTNNNELHKNKGGDDDTNRPVTVASWRSSFFSSKVVRAVSASAPDVDSAASLASWASSDSSGIEDPSLCVFKQKTEEVAENNLDVLVVREELRKARAEIAAQEKLALQQAHEMRNK